MAVTTPMVPRIHVRSRQPRLTLRVDRHWGEGQAGAPALRFVARTMSRGVSPVDLVLAWDALVVKPRRAFVGALLRRVDSAP